jgi:DNA repair protein RecN (Recombination protein N)
MLTSLHIRHFTLIDDVTLEWDPALNVLSGETGAGKSLILQALSLIVGRRGQLEWIRKGEAEATVSALFSLEGRDSFRAKIAELGIPLDSAEMLVQRTLSRTGRNRVLINGVPSTVSILSQIGNDLVDIVSQREHESLLKPEIQRQTLDKYGRLESMLESYQKTWKALKKEQTLLDGLEQEERQTLQMKEFLRFQVNEIEQAELKEDEEEKLVSEKGRAKNATRLGELCSFASDVFSSEENAVSARIDQLTKHVGRCVEFDPSLEKFLNPLQAVQIEMEDLRHALMDYAETIQCEPDRLECIEQRLAKIDQLKKKYGATIKEVLASGSLAKKRLDDLVDVEEEKGKIRSHMSKLEGDLERHDVALHKGRERAAKSLSGLLLKELYDLGIENALFEVVWEASLADGFTLGEKHYGRFGSKLATFYFSANPGEDLAPLARVASGGELSRILLALKKVLIDFTDLGCSIYDELDEGVGGATAGKLAEKLKQISKKRQVICITHQAQIAAAAKRHFLIEKSMHDKRVLTSVNEVKGKERTDEITRMMSGFESSHKAQAHARELLEHAQK